MLCNGVFEGGGVKGIGLVGAVCAMEDAGYIFEDVAGTSAGSIVACLISAGFSGKEIKSKMMKLDFKRLRGHTTLTRLGFVGKALKLLSTNGIYSPDYLESWLDDLLAKKNISRFVHIKDKSKTRRSPYRFQAVASDLSNSRMLVLPRDLRNFGIVPDNFSLSKAVRMSISIPLYFEPYNLVDVDGKNHVIVDGGLLSNYPMWLLDTRRSIMPTFGFKFLSSNCDTVYCGDYYSINNSRDYAQALLRTSLDAHDKFYESLNRGDLERTIGISTIVHRGDKPHEIAAVDFGIDEAEMEELFNNGYNAAKNFLREWSFEDWKARYANPDIRLARGAGRLSRGRATI
ncbi:MAG: patatin-like phospholipase family protein [Clostridiales bacterium]|jgi:NTE family protein|nr:patatin-like phospholipase family protein [Clostridiales bacterium]